MGDGGHILVPCRTVSRRLIIADNNSILDEGEDSLLRQLHSQISGSGLRNRMKVILFTVATSTPACNTRAIVRGPQNSGIGDHLRLTMAQTQASRTQA